MPDNKQQHESSKDEVERAPESGDPKETGRSQGKPVGEKTQDAGKAGKNEHWESGRHKAT
jgi:hypothetical protein